ncbi:hypothetical protein PENTCL1PPCAC_7198 [Pristionchus entomophagus]|uniref:GYF domain-containing protein n=1 Tax=Pristionchus entomophagus TaxID=358040 RepID=A0AAV5SPG2_9BILA|nr:hypothetical protein PENTCL1PPCAC_7198 [Pristionchus entomophagus]
MIHRSPETTTFAEESPFPRKFSSSLSRQNSNGASSNGYYQEEFIYYRPPDQEYFEGPFAELQVQYWYKEGYFYNGLEFKFSKDGPIETLDSLKARNGRECPFQEGIKSGGKERMVQTLMMRVGDLASDLEKMKEERNTQLISHDIERKALKNRVTNLMEKDTRNEQYRRETDQRLNDMQAEIERLRVSCGPAPPLTVVSVESGVEAATEEGEMTVGYRGPLSEMTAMDFSHEEDLMEVRKELVRLQNSIQSLDRFTFKLSHKVEKLKCKYKVVDIIGEGLNNKDGVFDRLSYLEQSMEEIQTVVGSMEKTVIGSTCSSYNEVVLPEERSNGTDQHSDGSITESWYSPNEKLPSSESNLTLTSTTFEAASESIAAVVSGVWPGVEKMVDVVEDQKDNWESIEDEECANAALNGEAEKREMETPPTDEDTVEIVAGDVDKENQETKLEGSADHLALLGNGLGMFLHSSESENENIAVDADIDRLLTAIKGAKMLQIAESLKHHFVKAMICDVCSTGEKKTELRNAIEYFEHLNRAHFKKCGGADKTLVNQFAILLEQFKAAVPVPIALAKRQYAEREKNKPWLKREGTGSPTRKIPKKKK